MTHPRWILYGLGVGLLGLALLLLWPSTAKQPPLSLVLADAQRTAFSLIYVAEQQGYLAEEQLSLTYRPFTSGRDALASVVRGESDIATCMEVPVVLNSLQGAPIRVLSTLHRSSSNTALVARRDQGIAAPTDLRGKRVGVTLNSNGELLLSRILSNEAIPKNAITRVDLPPPQMADALTEAEVAAVVTWTPYLAETQARFSPDQVLYYQSPLYSEVSMLATLEHSLTDKAEALGRLLRALVRAEDFIYQHNAQALDLVVDHLAPKGEAIIRATWPKIHFQARLDNLLRISLQNTLDWACTRTHCASGNLDLEPIFAPRPLTEARPQSVTIRLDRES